MKNLAYFAVASQQVTKHACSVKKIEGGYRAATSSWLQVHDSNVTPAEGAVPIKSWPIAGGTAADPAPFFQTFAGGELELVNGLYVCISTTDATKTLSTDTMDLSVEIQRADNSTTVVGDNTTGVTGLQVWSEAAGVTAKKLVNVRIDGTGLSAAAFIMLFSQDSPADGTKPIQTWPLADNQTRTLTFGDDGRQVYDNDDVGCTIVISSTAGTLTTIAAQTVTIRAEYK